MVSCMPKEIQQLIDGNNAFREKFFNVDNTLFKELAHQGQRPKVMVIACSDSRVDPAMIFNSQPGDLFVVRNVANLVPPCENTDNAYHGTSAALEFGTCFLEVRHIIILGHTQCGGIRALLEDTGTVLGKQLHSFIGTWMELARPAYDRVIAEHNQLALEDKITHCEQYALINSLQNLHSFPWIQQRVNTGMLSLHAWYFDLQSGHVHGYEPVHSTWTKL